MSRCKAKCSISSFAEPDSLLLYAEVSCRSSVMHAQVAGKMKMLVGWASVSYSIFAFYSSICIYIAVALYQLQ